MDFPKSDDARARTGAERRRDDLVGVGYILIDQFTVLTVAVLVKIAGAAFPAAQIAFLRGVIGTAFMLPYLPGLWRQRRLLRHPGIYLVRATFGAVSMVTNFMALAVLPLGIYTATKFTGPLAFLALAMVALRERVERKAWLAAGIGFLGVIVAVAPQVGAVDGVSLFGLGVIAVHILTGAVAVVAVRGLAGQPRAAVMLSYVFGMTVLLGPFAYAEWQPLAPRDWLMMLAIGMFSQIGLFCFVTAHRLASAAILAPIGYLQLILAPVAAYLVFGEWPTSALLVGGTIIIAAGLWNTLRR